jgi:hypothetical protein
VSSPRPSDGDFLSLDPASRSAGHPAEAPGVQPAEPTPERRPAANVAAVSAQWGLASLLLCGLVLLMVFLASAIAAVIPISVQVVNFWDTPARIAASVIIIALGVVFTAFSLFAVVFALAGLTWAGARDQPRPLHVAATAVGLLALVCWIVTTVACFFMALGIHNIR